MRTRKRVHFICDLSTQSISSHDSISTILNTRSSTAINRNKNNNIEKQFDTLKQRM